jgi:DNA-directed RNA polymerase specialized sigma24 family protein
MQSGVEIIKNYLKRYRFYKLQAETGVGGDGLKEQIDFLDKAVDALPPEDRKIIRLLFIDKTSAEMVARTCHCVRSTVYYRADKIIAQIAEIYAVRFAS